jgi:hypothetical protein
LLALSGCGSDTTDSTGGASIAQSSSAREISGNRNDWLDAVCELGTLEEGVGGFANAKGTGACRARAGGIALIGLFDSDYAMRNSLAQVGMSSYASAIEPDGTVFVIAVRSDTPTALSPLTGFGFEIYDAPQLGG